MEIQATSEALTATAEYMYLVYSFLYSRLQPYLFACLLQTAERMEGGTDFEGL